MNTKHNMTYGYIRTHPKNHKFVTVLLMLKPDADYVESETCDSPADATEYAQELGVTLVKNAFTLYGMVEQRRAAADTTSTDIYAYMEADALDKRADEDTCYAAPEFIAMLDAPIDDEPQHPAYAPRLPPMTRVYIGHNGVEAVVLRGNPNDANRYELAWREAPGYTVRRWYHIAAFEVTGAAKLLPLQVESGVVSA